MQSIVRPAVESDLPQIIELLHQKAEFDGCPEAFEANEDALKQAWFGDPRQAFVLVAETEGRLIGVATYFQTFSTFLGGPGIWLDDLFIRQEHRSRKIGHKIMVELAKIAQQRGCRRIEWTVALSNDRGISFYERHYASVRHGTRYVRLSNDGIERLATNGD